MREEKDNRVDGGDSTFIIFIIYGIENYYWRPLLLEEMGECYFRRLFTSRYLTLEEGLR